MSRSIWFDPVVLEGRHVRLEPLDLRHADELLALADPSIFAWMPVDPCASREAMLAWIDAAQRPCPDGPQVPFAVIDRLTGRVCGSTRYLAMCPEHRRLEIGWTWYGIRYRGTAVNAECKLLLLARAFEVLGCNRVEFKTDHMNTRSQAAIERLGAMREGVFRRHRVRRDGTLRDTVWYSIIREEWPGIRAGLERRLAERLGRRSAS